MKMDRDNLIFVVSPEGANALIDKIERVVEEDGSWYLNGIEVYVDDDLPVMIQLRDRHIYFTEKGMS